MIAIVVGSHGHLSRELINSAEMLIGKQDNIGYVEFFTGESLDVLNAKYENLMSILDTNDGVLVLTDIFGGSPYNAACKLAMTRKNTDIISGVNMPMLIEAFTVRESESLQIVVKSVIEAMNDSVKSFSETLISSTNADGQEDF